MEELELKFKQQNHLSLTNLIKNVINKIREYYESENKNEFDKYFKFLQEKCLNGNSSTCTTAIIGLIRLTENNEIISKERLFEGLMANIQNCTNLGGILYFISENLEEISFAKYNILLNPHPFITIYKKDNNVWPNLIMILKKSAGNIQRENLYLKMKPFVLYVLYDFERKINSTFQQELLSLFKNCIDEKTMATILLNLPSFLNRSFNYCQILMETNESIAFFMGLCIREMLRFELDPTLALYNLKTELNKLENFDYYEILLIILADCIKITPLAYLQDIIDICKFIIKKGVCDGESLNYVKTSLLIWKLQNAALNALHPDTNSSLTNLLTFQSKITTKIRKTTTKRVYDIDTFLTIEAVSGRISIDNLQLSPTALLNQLINFLTCTLYTSQDPQEIKKTLALILKCTAEDSMISLQILPVILLRLANNTNPQVLFELALALPKMGVLKENLPTISVTIKAISRSSAEMENMAHVLFYELLNVNKQSFHYLQDLIGKKKDNFQDKMVKALVLRNICKNNLGLEVYGSEITSYLAKILSDQREESNSVIQSFAFEGLKYLYHYDIINIGSAWTYLLPLYQEETRVDVIKSICEMLSEVGLTDVPEEEKEDNAKLLENAVRQLWYFTEKFPESEVVLQAAYKGLSCFNLEDVSLGIPECYLQETKHDVFNYIQGSCWMNLLINGPKLGLKYAGELLATFVAKEVRSFRKVVYDLKHDQREPTIMKNLSNHSVLGAVVHFVKKHLSNWRDSNPEVYIQCFNILSKKYSKPLPPMNWCFLHDSIHEPEVFIYCICLASNQCVISGSARRLMEDLISQYSKEEVPIENILCVYKCLKQLSNSIQPSILKPFIEKTIILLITNEKYEELNILADQFQEVIIDEGILEANKNVIIQVITLKVQNMDHNSKIFDILLNCIKSFPIKNLNELSCPSQFENLNSNIISRCLKIRSNAALSCTKDPFKYLDNFLQPHLFKQEQEKLSFKNISLEELFNWLKLIFIKHSENNKCAEWLSQLMVKIQFDIVENLNLECVLFACIVYIMVVTIISGFYVLRNPYISFIKLLEVFPYAQANLLKSRKYSSCISETLEWLYDIGWNENYKRNPETQCITEAFQTTLLILRNESAFNEKHKWMKYILMN